jgi:outer membrane protein assembly factor BamB
MTQHLFRSGLLALLCATAISSSHAASSPAWTAKLPEAVKWQETTSIGTLLVGTSGSICSLDPETGATQWTRSEFAKTSPFNVYEVQGTPVLLVNDHSSQFSPKTKIAALNIMTGETLWETEKEQGYPIGMFAFPARGVALVFSSGYVQGDGNGVFMAAYEIMTGKRLWRVKYSSISDVALHPSDNSGKFIITTDLSGHARPVLEGDLVYLPFTGAACYNLMTGEKKWGHEFKAVPKEFKRAAAGLVIDGDMIYASGVSKVVAIEKAGGTIKWESKKVFSGTIVQLLPAGDKVVARLGGNFLPVGAKEWKLEKPLRVIALNKADGVEAWEYKDIDDGITNLEFIESQNAIMVADSGALIGIDLNSTGKATEKFKVKLEFKRKIGGGEAAAKIGLGALGGLSGLAGGIGKSVSGKDRLDIPVSISKVEGGKVVVRGKQHLLSFDPAAQNIAWSTYYPAPGAAGWEMGVMVALTAAQGLAYNASYASGQSSLSSASGNISKTLEQFDKFQNKRYSATKTGRQLVYILTRVEDGGSKGVGLMAIDLATGDSAGQVLLKDKDPEYSVDDVMGRLFYVSGKSEITAYNLK